MTRRLLRALVNVRAAVRGANKTRRALALALGTAHLRLGTVLVRLAAHLTHAVVVAHLTR